MFSYLSQIKKKILKKVLEMSFKSKTAHLGSALSCLDILIVLYFKILKIDPKNPFSDNRDRFILSKGHAASALYATLAERGFFNKNLLKKYGKDGTTLATHVTRGSISGIEISSGSLGHGLAIANGIALAGEKEKKGYRVFVLLSDGECDEGSVWEAALFASHHHLDNLVAIVDYNKWQAFGRTNEILNLEPFSKKWESFGWSVKEIDGHNFQEIYQALKEIPFQKDKPSVVIAHTIKGKGISFLEDKLESHYHSLTPEEYKMVIKDINKL